MWVFYDIFLHAQNEDGSDSGKDSISLESFKVRACVLKTSPKIQNCTKEWLNVGVKWLAPTLHSIENTPEIVK